MNKNILYFAAVASSLFIGSLQAEPQIQLNRVQQRYPWSNRVDIDYVISGMDDVYSKAYRVELAVSAEIAGETVSITASNFLGLAWCDLPTSNGAWRVTWDAASDGVDFISGGATFSLKLFYDPVPLADAAYMIIDLSGGKDAQSYPARYVRGTGPDLQAFNHDIYKTRKIVLRRIKACTFKFGSSNVDTTIENDYFFSIFPVTQGQYQLVSGTNPSTHNADDGEDLAALRPVETLRKDQAETGFHAKLSSKVSVCGSLVAPFGHPTSEQWECACRAGTSTTYYWGGVSDLYLAYGWFARNSAGRTHAVGGKLPNAWGIFDMAGNASDWTSTKVGDSSWCIRGSDYTSAKVSDAASYKIGSYPTWLSQSKISVRVIQNLVSEESESVDDVMSSQVDVASLEGVCVDLRRSPSRKIDNSDMLFPFALNSSPEWISGGEQGVSSCVRMREMGASRPEDLSTWLHTDFVTTFPEIEGEEVCADYMPLKQGLYRAELLVGGAVVAMGYFDMTQARELETRPSIETLSVTKPSQAIYDPEGARLDGIVLFHEGKALVEGVDYIVTYENNEWIGMGRVSVSGVGDWGGRISWPFEVIPSRAKDVASAAKSGALNLVTDDVLTCTMGNSAVYTWNTCEMFSTNYPFASVWIIGGLPDEHNAVATVSLSPMSDPAGEPDDSRAITLRTASGEGAGRIKGVSSGYYLARLKVSIGGEVLPGELTRVLHIIGGLAIILK